MLLTLLNIELQSQRQTLSKAMLSELVNRIIDVAVQAKHRYIQEWHGSLNAADKWRTMAYML